MTLCWCDKSPPAGEDSAVAGIINGYLWAEASGFAVGHKTNNGEIFIVENATPKRPEWHFHF